MIRVAILVENSTIEAWIFEALKRVEALEFVEIVGVIDYPYTSRAKPFLYQKLRALDNRLFAQKDDAEEKREISKLFETTIKKQKLTAQDIASTNAEVVIHTGDRELPKDILEIPKYGVWRYHFGSLERYNSCVDGAFWESINSEDETEVSLVKLVDGVGSGDVLYRSYALTQKISPKKNIHYLKWLAMPFLARALKALHKEGEKYLTTAKRIAQKPKCQLPSNTQTLMLSTKYIYKFTKRLILKKRYDEEWFCMFSTNPKNRYDFSEFQKIISPQGILWADPFVVERENGGYYLFVEEMSYKENIGHISVLDMDKNGEIEKVTKIIDTGSHLSYPNVFFEDGEWWMIPESGASRKISLYKAVNFPYEWKLEKHLMEGVKSADTTLLKRDGKWWMFVNIDESQKTLLYNELYLFSSDDFRSSEWKPHPMNPIISDVKYSRPAGKIYEENGKLIRPSQYSAVRYGYALVLNEIVTLNETEYEERVIEIKKPTWDPKIGGLHTYNRAGDMTVIDAWGLRKKG